MPDHDVYVQGSSDCHDDVKSVLLVRHHCSDDFPYRMGFGARAHRADQNPDIKSGAEGGAPARLQPRRLELRPSPLAQAAPLPLSSA